MVNNNSEKSDQPAKKAPKKSNILKRLLRLENPTKKEQAAKEKEIDKELKSIYKDAKGNMPNLTKLDFKPKNRERNIVFGLIVVLLIIFVVTIFGFFAFKPNPNYSGNKVRLEIKAPFTVNSGDKINYQIKFTNNEGVSLTNAVLNVSLPAGFIFINSNIPPINVPDQNPEIKTWKINDLFIDQTQIIDINGVMVGPLASKPIINAALSYTPANFSSEFQKNATFTTEITDSLISLTGEYNAQVANEDIAEIKVKIANKSTEMALSNLQIGLEFPAEFSLLETLLINPLETAKALDAKALNQVQPAASPQITEINSLLPQEEKTIIYRGKFNVSESRKIDLNVQAKLKGQEDEYILQKEEKMTLEIIKGDLLTNLIIQGSNQNKPISAGTTLNYLLSIENKSKKILGDIKVRAVLDSLFFDWSSLNDESQGNQQDNQILWTSSQIPALTNLLPEEEVEISFQIKLKNLQAVKNYKAEDMMVKSFFETQVNKINNENTELTNQSNTIINEFNTDLAFTSEGRYFGAQSETLGAGPLPPIVGQKTTYKIFWQLNNSLHEITDITVKVKLPDYITYEANENLSTGNIFKNQNNEIVWQIARLPNTVNNTTADFEISLTPQTQDVAKILTLMQEGTLTATDSQTKDQMSITFQGLTTNLDSDPLGNGKGLIQAE